MLSLRFTFSLKTLLSIYLSVWLAIVPLFAHGAVETDGTTNTGVDRSRNGVEIVNIARPNEHNVSVNNYLRFDVDPSGLVLNNSDKVGTSVLAGATYANPNFQNGDAASIILNQVTSDKISHLYGYTEIFGENAALVIANPNGIYAKGAGFINTNDVSLISGIGEFNNGYPNQYRLGLGQILIEGGEQNLGIDARGANYLRLISRLQDIRGEVLASGTLELQAANDTYNYDQHLAASLSFTSSGNLAIQAIGSMYADSIRLVSTEQGLGVKLDADLVAKVDDIVITAAGQLSYQNLLANKDINLTAPDIRQQSQGQLYSQSGNANLSASNSIELHGDVMLAEQLSIQAKQLLTSANTQTHNGSIYAKHIHINADYSTLSNSIIADALTLAGQNTFINAPEIHVSTANIGVNKFTNSSHLTINQLTLASDTLHNSGILHDTQGLWHVNVSQQLTNQGSIWFADDYHLNTQYIDNQGTLASNAALTLSGQTFNNSGHLQSTGDLHLHSNNSSNTGSIYSFANVQLTGEKIDNAAHLESAQHLSSYATVDNSGQWLVAGNSSYHNSLSNTGAMQLVGTSHFSGDNLHNAGYLESSAHSSIVNSSASINNSGIWLAGSQHIDAQHLDNSAHLQTTNSDYHLDALENQGQLISDNLNVNATTINNNGVLQVSGNAQLHADVISNNSSGQILVLADLQLGDISTPANNRFDNFGTLLINGDLSSDLALWNSGFIQTAGKMNAQGDVHNSSNATIVVGDDLTIDANVHNSGSINAHATATFNADLHNFAQLGVKNQLIFNGNSLHNYTNAQLIAQSGMLLDKANASVYNAGTLIAQGDNKLNVDALIQQGNMQLSTAQINVNTLSNQGKLILQGESQIISTNTDNTGILATENANWQVQEQLNNSGQWLTQGNLTLQVPQLHNAGQWQTNGEVIAEGIEYLRNSTAAKLSAERLVLLNADQVQFDNQGDTYVHDDLLFVFSEFRLHNSGQIAANQILSHLSDSSQLHNQGKIIAYEIALTATFNQGENGHLIGKYIDLTGEWQQTQGSISASERLDLRANNLSLGTQQLVPR